MLIGETLGSYRVVAKLGEGGMGEVYRARDSKLNRDVAIKVLPELFASDADRLGRFTREAQVLAALNHPNIAQIYGVEDSGRAPALVMELVEGEDLSARIARGPISVAEAVTIARQIADALEAAHERGIIHRDLKPANVKISRDGLVKVLDFGLAKAGALAGAGMLDGDLLNSPTVTASPTEAGMILGTAAYMAPEQAQGRSVDKRADIWAFGVLLYEMLSGRPVFGGTSTAEVLAAVIKDAPDWTALPIEVPSAVRRLLARSLAKDPRQRLRDVGDARLELEPASETTPDAPARLRTRSMVPLWVVGIAVAATGIAAALVGLAVRSPTEPPSGGPRRAGIQIRGLGDSRAFTFAVALSGDGSRLVYASTGHASGGRLYLRRLDSLEAEPIEGTMGALGPFLSPDGRHVGFQREAAIFSVPVTGGPVIQARGSAHLPEGHPAWMHDGRIVYTSPSGGLVTMNPDGSASQMLTTPDPGERHLSPHPLPDGRTVLFTVAARDASAAGVAAVSLDDRRVRTLIADGAVTAQYADGYLVFARPDGRLMAAPFDPLRVEMTGATRALADHVSRTRFGVAHFAVARGLLVYLPRAETRLVELDRTGQRESLDIAPGLWHHPRYSRDGTRIVMDLTNAAGERDVWIFDRALKTLSRATRVGDAHDPSWLPDGRSISFLSFKSDGGPLMVVPPDGTTAPEPVSLGHEFAAADFVNPGSWLPNGTAYVGGVKDRGAPGDIWLVPRTTGSGPPVRVVSTPADEQAPSVSPDGKWVAYQSDETGRVEIYVRGLDRRAGRVQVSNLGGSEPVWDPSGTKVYYVEAAGDRKRLIAAALRTGPTIATLGRSVLLSDVRFEESDNHANYDIHPDGGRFILPEVEARGGLVAVFDWARSFAPGASR